MKRSLKIFWLFSTFSLSTTMQARSGLLFFTLGKILRFATLFLFIFLIFSRTRLIQGYNFNQIAVFFLTFNIIDTLSQVMFREVYRFRWLVVEGELDGILLKPYHPFLRVLVGGVDFVDLLLAIPFIGMLVFFVSRISPLPSAVNILNFSLLTLNSLVLATAFHIVVLSLGILTTEVDHTIMIYRDLTQIARFPIDIYREPVRGFFTFVIPVGVMMSFPAKTLFGLLTWPFILYSFVLSWGLLYMAVRLWNYALRKYQSASS